MVAAAAIFGVVFVQIAGAHVATTPLIGSVSAGKTLFKAQGCGKCHTLAAAESTGTIGPNLNTLKPSQALVATQVTTGGGFMPSFGGTLSKAQIDDIAAYVYSSTHNQTVPPPTQGAATVTVVAGKPSTFAFTLSTKTVRLGTVTFKVTNKGSIAHSFKVCSSDTGGSANSCAGKGTATISPGKSATLTITFKTKGKYEYLCAIPGHAAAGMKGDLTVT